jgi:hypothetical protein
LKALLPIDRAAGAAARHARPTLLLAAAIALAASEAVAQPGIGTCIMGETRAVTYGQNGLYGLGITVYQWFDPTTCGFCLMSEGAIRLKTVEVQAFSSKPTDTMVGATVSILGWKGSLECPMPDESAVLLAPQPVTFDVPAMPVTTQVGTFTLRAPIIGSPLFAAPAFIKLEFTPAATTSADPALGQIVAGTCASCRQYITSMLQHAVMADACSGGSLYPWVLRARGDCEAATAAQKTTWGRLKLFYH